ncbi:hypothetical protein GGU10DRAFT_279274, partial [Lentinula aff. detonsa]
KILLCKHLVQGVECVPPIFFLEVKRSRTAPVWSHPLLKPLHTENSDRGIEDAEKMDEITAEIEELELEDEGEGSDDEDEEGSEAAREISMQHLTYDEQMSNLVRSLHSFADGLAYQVQFRDDRMLDAVFRYGGSFVRMMEACLEKERRQNANSGAPLATWDAGAVSSMYYRSRPRRGEEAT